MSVSDEPRWRTILTRWLSPPDRRRELSQVKAQIAEPDGDEIVERAARASSIGSPRVP